jgi:hypothetical protein
MKMLLPHRIPIRVKSLRPGAALLIRMVSVRLILLHLLRKLAKNLLQRIPAAGITAKWILIHILSPFMFKNFVTLIHAEKYIIFINFKQLI